MNSVSINYAVVWELDFAPEYKWTIDGICINTKRNVVLKQVMNARCIGYNIRSKFYSLQYLRSHLVKITNNACPF